MSNNQRMTFADEITAITKNILTKIEKSELKC